MFLIKGLTNYIVSLAVLGIVKAIVRDESSVLPVSTLMGIWS